LSQFQLLNGTVFTDKSIASLRALISWKNNKSFLSQRTLCSHI